MLSLFRSTDRSQVGEGRWANEGGGPASEREAARRGEREMNGVGQEGALMERRREV
jgi:hypothetical protein